ncbi:MAG: hypothetical protein IT426_03990 [Pirellulales bacterium]|nr:hypothetical protein [Pirellulales bacterium]
MKAKLKLDKTAIKKFFIDHAEKVVFGIVALGAATIIYGAATGREKTDKRPEELLTQVAAAKSAIENARIEEKKAEEIDKITGMSRQPIDDSPYQLTKAILPPIGKSSRLRGEPPVLGTIKLAAAAGSGMFQIMTAPPTPGNNSAAVANVPGSDQRGMRWASVTGLVPFKKQRDAYSDAYRDCKQLDLVKDSMPDYRGYWVQRLEVFSPADLQNPNWSDAKKVVKFQSNTVEDEVKKDWGQSMQPDPVDPRFIHPYLSFPLGPLVDGTWDAKVAHAPEIPILTNEAIMGMAAPAPDAAAEKKPGEAGAFDNRPTVAGAGGGFYGGMPMGGERGYGAMPMGYGAMAGGMAMDAGGPEYLLFRFFDFTVKPGKRYIYRVQLVLSNPNFEANAAYLEDPQMAKKRYLVDEKWSDPSPPVGIPNDTSTLAVAVEQPRRLSGDPLGSMIVALWQQNTGKKLYNEFAVERGQVLNFTDAEVKAVQRTQYAEPTDTPDNTPLVSDVLVVDLAGGKKLPAVKPKPEPAAVTDQFNRRIPDADRMPFSPGEILVMEPDGTLVVRGEFDDMDRVAGYTSTPNQAMPVGMPGGMPGHGMPGGFGPGMEGYGPPRMQGGYGPPGMQGYGPPGMMRGGEGFRGEGPMRGGYGELFGGPGGAPPAPRKGGR